jgi:hypothetical protein
MKNNFKDYAISFSVVLAILYLAGCDGGDEPVKEPEKGSNETRITGVYTPNYGGYNSIEKYNFLGADFYADKIAGATVRLFATEADYLLNENPVHEFLSSAYTFPQDDTVIYDFKETFYWVRVNKGKLNNLRQASSVKKTQLVRPTPCCGMVIDVVLSTTPTKLRITVVDQGVTVQGATVQLYFSESDYANNIPAQSNRSEVATSYGSGYISNFDPSQGTVALTHFFNALTDANGEVYFDNLEPRHYWIKVIKGSKSNGSGTIKTSSALPDNPDITTTLTIGIN